MFIKPFCLLMLLMSAFVVAGAQSKAVHVVDRDRTQAPYKLLKQQVEGVSSRMVEDYKVAVKHGDEVKAVELLSTVGSVLMTVYELEFSNSLALKAGWTQKEIDAHLPKLVKRADSVRRRLKKIQQAHKRVSPRDSLFTCKNRVDVL